MKKNLSLRIIGIGSIILLIASLFLPFTNYNGFSFNLFENAKQLNFMPYIIIGFGFIACITLILGKKVELGYLLVGSSITIIIINTVSLIDNFNYLSLGYYLLAFSSIVLFIALFLYSNNDKRKDVSINRINDETSENDLNNNINMIDNKPTELAQSIMNQPVMKNANDIELNNQSIEIEEANNDDSFKLSPQNPLNSFLPSDFDPSKVELSSLDDNKDLNYEQEINKSQENSSDQSILSVMSQPMISDQMIQNNPVVEPSIPVQPTIENNPVVEPSIPVQPTIENNPAVEPSIPVQPTIENNPVVEPSIPVQPTIENNPVVEPSIPVQPTIENNPVVEPSIPVQPTIENNPAVEPSIPDIFK